MARYKAKYPKPNNEYISYLEDLLSKNDSAYQELLTAWRRTALEYVNKLTFTEGTKLNANPENLAIINGLDRASQEIAGRWLGDVAAPQDYIDMVNQGLFPGTPDTLYGTFAEKAATLAKNMNTMAGVDTNVLISEQLNKTTNATTSALLKDKDNLLSTIRNSMRIGQKFGDLVEWISNKYDVNVGLGHTIAQAHYMGVYRNYDLELAQKIGTDLFLHDGPYPLQGKAGHPLCQDHYREVHTYAEWIDIGAGYGIPEEDVFQWVGSYGCRHKFLAIDKSIEKYASGS